jgi:hypothetical protein
MRIEHFKDKNASPVEDLAVEFIVKHAASVVHGNIRGLQGL